MANKYCEWMIEVGVMLIDTNLTIAYRCPVCGRFRFNGVSYFSLAAGRINILGSCCGREIKTLRVKRDIHEINVPCIGCGENHRVRINARKVLHKGMGIFICENTGIKYCFIGKNGYVNNMVDNYEKELDGIADCLGYDNYFKNSHVMLDTLIKLNEMAEQDNLFCECGSADIEISLFSDRIYLKCRNCPGEKVIYASSNKDLEDILLKKKMLLSRHFDRIL